MVERYETEADRCPATDGAEHRFISIRRDLFQCYLKAGHEGNHRGEGWSQAADDHRLTRIWNYDGRNGLPGMTPKEGPAT